MKREQISEAVGGIRTQFIEEAGQYSPKRHAFFRRGLVAAAVGLAILLSAILSPGTDNSFTVKAYALDLDNSGTVVVLREEDLLEKSDYWGGYQDGDTFYINTGFRYEGTNLESVTFTTEEGFLAAQRITPDLADSVMKAYVGPENRLIVFGRDFEILGSTVTLEDGEMENDLLLFWAVQADCSDDIPQNPKLTAVATFKNGKTQRIDLHLDLSGGGVFVRSAATGNEPSLAVRKSRYYGSLPLEACELVDEQVVTDVYEYPIDGYTISHKVPEERAFDEHGVYRSRRLRISGAFYLPVFQRDGDTMTARLYRVPKELEFSEENEQALALRQTEPPAPAVPASDGEAPSEVIVLKPTGPSAQTPKPEVPYATEPSAAKEAGNPPSRSHHIRSDEEQERMAKYYNSLPLEKCELVDEQPMTNIYWVKNTVAVQVYEDSVFDEDGYYRPVWHVYDEGAFLGVAYRDENGDRWGQTYRVPDDLVYSE